MQNKTPKGFQYTFLQGVILSDGWRTSGSGGGQGRGWIG